MYDKDNSPFGYNTIGRYTMESLFTILKEIFFGTDADNTKVGLSEFKTKTTATIQNVKAKNIFTNTKPKELRLSELMRKASY